jgi:hypothetical protein
VHSLSVATGITHALPARGPAASGCVLSSTSTVATISLSATGSRNAPNADEAFCSHRQQQPQQSRQQQATSKPPASQQQPSAYLQAVLQHMTRLPACNSMQDPCCTRCNRAPRINCGPAQSTKHTQADCCCLIQTATARWCMKPHHLSCKVPVKPIS